MQKILAIIVIFLIVVLVVELGYFFIIKQKHTCPPIDKSVVCSTLSDNEKMNKHNFDEIYTDTVGNKTDIISSSVLTNTYYGQIIKLSNKPGTIKEVNYQYDLWIKLEGQLGSSKNFFFTSDQIKKMEKEGFTDIKDLKVGNTVKITLTYSLVSDEAEKTTTLVSSKIKKIN